MSLRKCPRCDLNYITENERYCKVCLREMKGSVREEVEMCSICNEEPALPGRDVCIFCLREMTNAQAATSNHDNTEEESPDTHVVNSMDSVSTMDEIMPEIDDDLPGDMESDIRQDPDAIFEADEDELDDEAEVDPDDPYTRLEAELNGEYGEEFEDKP